MYWYIWLNIDDCEESGSSASKGRYCGGITGIVLNIKVDNGVFVL